MSRQTLQERVVELRETLAALEDELANDPNAFPKNGDTYYFLSSGGINDFQHRDDRTDLIITSAQPVFATRTEAEIAHRFRIAVTAINKKIKQLNADQGWVAEWSGVGCTQLKHHLEYNYDHKQWSTDAWTSYRVQFLFTPCSQRTCEYILANYAAELADILAGAP